MVDFPFDIVGFDLDGTLLDTSGDLCAAVNHALADVGRPPLSIAEIKPMIGGGGKVMLKHGLDARGVPDQELDRLFFLMLEYYAANVAVHTRPFDGVLDAMDAMADRGVKFGIVTNKFENLAVKIIAELGLSDRFVTILGGDTLGKDRAKPQPDPIHEMITRCGGGSCAFIGDSAYDTMAARAAGVPSVVVSFGFLMQPIEELKATAVIDHYDELIPTLERLSVSV
jgi:phosphoglycolate phosphatase